MEGPSMNLIIDRGNSRTKLALFRGRELMDQRQFLKSESEEASIHTYLNELPEADRCLYADTRGTAFNFTNQIPGLLELASISRFPVEMGYETPSTLGPDRIANACAAFALFPGEDVLVLDAGTCITYDLLVKNSFIGGAISPGITMRIQALNHYTGKLPLLSAPFEAIEIGKNTRDSILSGTVSGAIFEAEERISVYNRRFPGLKVAVTGGDMAYFENGLKSPIFADANLTLLGLNEILLHQGS